MVPSMMQDLLFDDILFGARAREEHRRFRQVLKFVADEVLEARDLLEEVLQDAQARNLVLSELAAASRLAARGSPRPQRPPRGPTRGMPRRGDRAGAAGDHGLARVPLPPAARAELVLPTRPGGRRRRPRDPERDGDAGPAGASRCLSGAIFAFHPRFGRRSDAFWFREFAAEDGGRLARADAPDARGRGRPRAVRRDARDRVLGADREDHDRAARRGASRRKVAVKSILVVAIPPQRATMHLDTIFTRLSAGECLCYGPMILRAARRRSTSTRRTSRGREVSWTTKDDLLSALRTTESTSSRSRAAATTRSTSSGSSGPTARTSSLSRPGSSSATTATRGRPKSCAARLPHPLGRRPAPRARRRSSARRPVKQAILMSAPELSRARGGPRCMTMPLVREPV